MQCNFNYGIAANYDQRHGRWDLKDFVAIVVNMCKPTLTIRNAIGSTVLAGRNKPASLIVKPIARTFSASA